MKKNIIKAMISCCALSIFSYNIKPNLPKNSKIGSCIKYNKNNNEKIYGDEFESGSAIYNGSSSEYFEINENGAYLDIKNDIKTNSYDNLNTYAITPDQNENNNSFETASVIFDVTSREIGGYGLYIGWWANIHDKNDLDYYSYDVFMDGEITIKLSNIPNGCDYDLEFYRMSNSLTSSCNDSELVSSSKQTGNTDDEIIINVIPGTYYALVKSYNGASEESYHIEFTLIDGRSYDKGHYNISEHKKNGDKAALWVSDYTPCSAELNFSDVTNTNIEISNYSKYPMIKHLSNKYDSSKDIVYRCLFVWDVQIRRFIRDYCNIIWQYLNDTYKNGDPYLNDLIVSLNASSMAMSVSSLVIGIVPYTAIASAIISAFAIYCSFSAMDKDSKNASFRGKVSEIKDYLLAIIHEMNIGDNVEESDEVIVIKTCYRFEEKTEGSLWWKKTKHYIDCSQKYRSNNLSSYIYEKDTIDFYLEGSPINGSIIGISSQDDLKGAIKK